MVKNVANHAPGYPADAAARLSTVGCVIPFRTIEIHQDGDITLCCYTWLPEFCGNILTDTPQQILENFKRQAILQGMRQGRFDHCTDHCPRLTEFIVNGSHYNLVPLADMDISIANTAFRVYLTYDKSCNLQCPSCRSSLIMHKLEDQHNPIAVKLIQIHAKVKQLIQLLLDQGHTVTLDITGSGDPFASQIYWNYLKELSAGPVNSNLAIGLHTNGIMMTEKHWAEIKPLWPRIIGMNVSVDAATAETYRLVRKGGNFETLVKNLDNLDAMIARGDLPGLNSWINNIIVQKDNFKELKHFMEWQLSYKSLHRVWTNLISQWGHISDEEYQSMAIWKQGHHLRDQLIDILKDPIFRDPRIDLGNMINLMPPAAQGQQ